MPPCFTSCWTRGVQQYSLEEHNGAGPDRFERDGGQSGQSGIDKETEMVLAYRGMPLASQLPPAGPGQGEQNRLEQALVHFLVDEVIDQLTDRSGTTHLFPWTPEQGVRVGVLGPTFDTQPPSGSTATSAASSPPPGGVTAPPIENRGVIGLDFVVAGGVSEVPLTVEVNYALYHPTLPQFSDINASAQRVPQGGAGNRRRRPNVAIRPNWRRDERFVRYQVTVPLGTDDTSVSSADDPANPFVVDARAAVDDHYADPDALFKLTRNQTLPVAAALGDAAQFHQALVARKDPQWQPAWPVPELTVTTSPTVESDVAVSVSLTNALILTEHTVQDLALYDTRLLVRIQPPVSLRPQQLGFAADDLRYAQVATVPGRGRGCVAVAGETPETIVAETLPFHTQRTTRVMTHGADLSFAGLAQNHEATLATIGAAMRKFLDNWDLSNMNGAALDQAVKRRSDFEAETERFELGCELLEHDERLRLAFVHANQAFARARPSGAWFLFQLVFIVSELGALAGREHPEHPRLRNELDSVDVLWFPTGGGKTEAYLGLILVALFYDRLRGKLRGVSAWMLFPLRMLSVQQLARISDVLFHADQVRRAESVGGQPFSLGYLVGANNTPNRLGYANNWWPGLEKFARWTEAERNVRRLVGRCPKCQEANSVCLDADLAKARLLHRCHACDHVLDIYASDEEITRYQPSVIISTVDKVTSFAYSGQFTSFTHGPRKSCPEHGWYTHSKCLAKDCSTNPSTHGDPSGFYDPVPALWVQDELHLVREDLGVFASHYHTLVAELAAAAGHQPSKVIAATATIEQFEDQLSQVYGRRPRMFPVGGPTLTRSFYNEVTDDVRRVYLGVLPSGGGTAKVDVASEITSHFVERVHRLMDDPAPLVAALADEGITCDATAARQHLLDYEVALSYVNSKAHGVAVVDDLSRVSRRLIDDGSDPIHHAYLMGETPLGELAGVVASLQQDPNGVHRSQRIRALVGTAVVSHGVDLDRLNLEVLAGMPPTYAMYIQAASRAGRTHVGVIVSVFDRLNRRETSVYQGFETTHRALEKMVEPVPVNRYATRAVERTLPGILCALLWDETRNGNWSSTDEITFTRTFKRWWGAVGDPLGQHLRVRIERAYRCPVAGVAPAQEEEKLVESALYRWDNIERQRMQQWQAEYLWELFTSPAMTSLRDVDPPVFFSGGPRAQQIIDRLSRLGA